MISPCLTQQHVPVPTYKVRVVKIIDDPYAGLKGHAYIEARNLKTLVQRVQTSAHVQVNVPNEACNGR